MRSFKFLRCFSRVAHDEDDDDDDDDEDDDDDVYVDLVVLR